MKCPELTEMFVNFFHMPNEISSENVSVLQKFVIRMYDSSIECHTVNEARKKLFAKKGKSVENIPPTLDALVQHTRRAVFQAGFIWSQSMILQPILPCPSDWGWKLIDDCWRPVWMTIPSAAKSCSELKKCGCKSGCTTRRCTCLMNGIPCTA